MDIDNINGLDKAAILFQILGESLALSMFQGISEANTLRIRVRSRELRNICLLYTSPSPRDKHRSRMPSSA